MSGTDTPRPPNQVVMEWKGAHLFDAGRPGGPMFRMDSDAGPSPVDALLGAIAGCTATDIVDIMAKRRTPLASLRANVIGHRADGTPRRLVKVHLEYEVAGDGIEAAQLQRAVDLSVTKYCSVRDSLDPAIPVTWSITLNGSLLAE
ncbi:MAG: OsmC family protein [Gemmatimonadaceae bacterium]|nr:OsmC family protein [Gemmatimonadaceae bacterium]